MQCRYWDDFAVVFLDPLLPGTEVEVTWLARPEPRLAEVLASPGLLADRVSTAGAVLFQNIAHSWQAFLELKCQAGSAENQLLLQWELTRLSAFVQCCAGGDQLERGWVLQKHHVTTQGLVSIQ